MASPRIPIEEINSRKPLKSKFTAIEYVERHISKGGVTRSVVKCICACGEFKDCVVADLIRGNPLSCKKCRGLNSSVNASQRNILHKRWYDMRERCYNPRNAGYKDYGAKGVKVCNEWLNNFESFLNWAVNNGYKPRLELDKDVIGNGLLYSPQTCKWVTKIENMSNTSRTVRHNYNGEMLTIPEISRKTGVLQSTLKGRLLIGKTIEEAVAETLKPRFKIYSNSL